MLRHRSVESAEQRWLGESNIVEERLLENIYTSSPIRVFKLRSRITVTVYKNVTATDDGGSLTHHQLELLVSQEASHTMLADNATSPSPQAYNTILHMSSARGDGSHMNSTYARSDHLGKRTLGDYADIKEQVQDKIRYSSDRIEILSKGNLLHIDYSENYLSWGWRKLEEAVQIYAEGAKQLASEFGEQHAVSILVSIYLAILKDGMGYFQEAKEIREHLWRSICVGQGEETVSRYALDIYTAVSYMNLGQWEIARKIQEARVATASGNNKSDLVMAAELSRLGTIYRRQGRWKDAERVELEVLKMKELVLGSEHPETLSAMAHLAITYTEQGRWLEAEKLNIDVLRIRKKVLGLEHQDTLTGMANVCSTYMDLGQWFDAEQLSLEILNTRRRILPPNHPDILTSMSHVGSICAHPGRFREAEELNMQVLAERTTRLGPDHPETLTSMTNLAATYSYQGRWQEALELENKVLKMRKMVSGPEHPDTLSSIANLTSTFGQLGRWKDAENLNLEVLEKRKQILSKEHPETLGSMGNHAIICFEQGSLVEAMELIVRTIDISKSSRQRAPGNSYQFSNSRINICAPGTLC